MADVAEERALARPSGPESAEAFAARMEAKLAANPALRQNVITAPRSTAGKVFKGGGNALLMLLDAASIPEQMRAAEEELQMQHLRGLARDLGGGDPIRERGILQYLQGLEESGRESPILRSVPRRPRMI